MFLIKYWILFLPIELSLSVDDKNNKPSAPITAPPKRLPLNNAVINAPTPIKVKSLLFLRLGV